MEAAAQMTENRGYEWLRRSEMLSGSQRGDRKAIQHFSNPFPSHLESTDAGAQVVLHTLPKWKHLETCLETHHNTFGNMPGDLASALRPSSGAPGAVSRS